jgi:hypothetical protein
LRRIGPLHYLRPSWKWKASRMWDRVKNPGSKRTTSSFIRSHIMKGNGTKGKTLWKGESPNSSKARGSSSKETLLRKGLLLNRANPKGMLVGSPREHASTITKWGITPNFAPSPNRGMGALR